MKVKTYFSTIAFLIFFPPTEFCKNRYIYASDWSKLSPKIFKKFTDRKRKYWRAKLENMKKSRTTRSHFTHARSCLRALNWVPTRAKWPAFTRTYSLWQGDIFPFDRLTGYEKSKQNQIGRVLPFAFALQCIRIYLLFSPLSGFDSFRWRVHLS